jgi:hypothetical protein
VLVRFQTRPGARFSQAFPAQHFRPVYLFGRAQLVICHARWEFHSLTSVVALRLVLWCCVCFSARIFLAAACNLQRPVDFFLRGCVFFFSQRRSCPPAIKACEPSVPASFIDLGLVVVLPCSNCYSAPGMICFSSLCWVAALADCTDLRLPLICVRPVTAVVIQVPQCCLCCD